MEIVTQLARDLSYGQIAVSLGISRETVKAHARRVRRCLGVSSNEAAIYQLSDMIQSFLKGKE
jgi:DNA-binding CsgD family transcriptional regulator